MGQGGPMKVGIRKLGLPLRATIRSKRKDELRQDQVRRTYSARKTDGSVRGGAWGGCAGRPAPPAPRPRPELCHTLPGLLQPGLCVAHERQPPINEMLQFVGKCQLSRAQMGNTGTGSTQCLEVPSAVGPRVCTAATSSSAPCVCFPPSPHLTPVMSFWAHL